MSQETDSPPGNDVLNKTPYVIAGSVLSDEDLLREAERGLSRLYNMEYELADSIFSAIDARYPGHPVGPFLRALVTWWRILPQLDSGGDAADDEFFASMELVIKRSDKLLKTDSKSFDGMFFKGAALGFRGRLHSNRRKWLRAGADGKRALEYIFDIAAADTSNADFQFGAGVYNYFAAIIPDRYPIVKPMLFFFPHADREKGLRSLEFTAASGRLIRTEAAYFLLQIHLLYEPNYQESVRYASWLTGRYPANAFFRLLQGRVYVRWGEWPEAMIAFERVNEGHDAGTPGYTDALAAISQYYTGRYHMRADRLSDALDAFRIVDSLSSLHKMETFYRVNAVLRLGMIYDLLDERGNALAAYGRVLDMENRGEAHDRAKGFQKDPYRRQ